MVSRADRSCGVVFTYAPILSLSLPLSGCRALCWTTEQAIVRHVNFQQIKCLLLGSPGFVKDDFFEFLNLEAVRREERVSLRTSIGYGWLVVAQMRGVGNYTRMSTGWAWVVAKMCGCTLNSGPLLSHRLVPVDGDMFGITNRRSQRKITLLSTNARLQQRIGIELGRDLCRVPTVCDRLALQVSRQEVQDPPAYSGLTYTNAAVTCAVPISSR